MPFFSNKEKKPEIAIIDKIISEYKPICQHCEKEIVELHRFLSNCNEDAIYACPHCHKIVCGGRS
jgi:hypothetical protein